MQFLIARPRLPILGGEKKQGLGSKSPDGAEVSEAIDLIPRFSPTPEAACAYAASLHLLWEGRPGELKLQEPEIMN